MTHLINLEYHKTIIKDCNNKTNNKTIIKVSKNMLQGQGSNHAK